MREIYRANENLSAKLEERLIAVWASTEITAEEPLIGTEEAMVQDRNVEVMLAAVVFVDDRTEAMVLETCE